MRADMDKVIVERPRGGRRWAHGQGTRTRAAKFGDLENMPGREGIGPRGRGVSRKHLNENLRPLIRYLHRQVGRPWNKVYSEMCSAVPGQNAVQAHVYAHLWMEVARDVVMIDGVPHETSAGHEYLPLVTWRKRGHLYVHPVDGLLKFYKPTEADLERYYASRRARYWRPNPPKAEPEVETRKIGPLEELRKDGGIWYYVRLYELPPDPKSREHYYHRELKLWLPKPTFGWTEKHQLSKKELRRYGVANDRGEP